MSSTFIYEIGLHGFLFWASMGLLMPVGVVAMRMSNREQHATRAKLLSIFILPYRQISAVVVATTGAILSIRRFENSFNYIHQRVGLALYFLVWLQALTGIFRPLGKGRRLWYLVHWVLGTSVSLVGVINIFTGLQAYQKKTSKSSKMWTILFTIQIAFIALFYLLQEKHGYIQKQGMMSLGNEPVRPTHQDTTSPTNNQNLIAATTEAQIKLANI